MLDAVNIANYVAMGKGPIKQFETSWPECFYQTKWLPCLSAISMKLGSTGCSDTNLVYLRVMDVYR